MSDGEHDVASLLSDLRAGGRSATSASVTLAHTEVAADGARRERLRAEVARALAHSLRPTDYVLVHWLLTEEIAAHEARGSGASEALYTLVAAVARFADPGDALLLWRARMATPETRAGVDVEQVGRLGLAATRAALLRHVDRGDEEAQPAREMLAWLDDGAAAGAFDDLSGYFLWADERFGLNISGPT